MSDSFTDFNTSAQVERIRARLSQRSTEAPPLAPARDETAPLPLPQAPLPRPAAPKPETESSAYHREIITQLQESQTLVLEEMKRMQQAIMEESRVRHEQIQSLTQHLSLMTRELRDVSARQKQSSAPSLTSEFQELSAEMASRIDARVREILHHLQTELLQWRTHMDRELQAVRETKADKTVLQSRLARIASAAMEDEPVTAPAEGFLL